MIYKYWIIGNTFIFLFSFATWYNSRKNIRYIEENHEDEYENIMSKITKLEKKLEYKEKMIVELKNEVGNLKQIVLELDVLLSCGKNAELMMDNHLKIINPELFTDYNYNLKEQCQAPYYFQGCDSTGKKITPIDKEWATII